MVAFEDAVKGYLDYPAMMTAYLRAQLAGEDFVLEQYCDSDAAVVYSGSVTAVNIVNQDGQIEEP